MDPLRGFVLAKDTTCVFLVPRCAAGLFAFTVVAEPGNGRARFGKSDLCLAHCP